MKQHTTRRHTHTTHTAARHDRAYASMLPEPGFRDDSLARASRALRWHLPPARAVHTFLSPAAQWAILIDTRWFARHPGHLLRIRHLVPGEFPPGYDARCAT